MLTDTHCHVLSREYSDINEIINNLKSNNIKRIIINGYDYETNQEVINLVAKYENIYGALGIHPDNIDEDFDKTLEFIKKNINNPKILAVGEIGLDYFHNKNNIEKQIECFTKQLDLAHEFNKPVIIHCREAISDSIKVLKEYNLKGIIHCFSGSYETANEYIKLGYKLGINGIVTFKNTNLPQTLKKINIENLLLETDCPYITPEPYRKYPNEPKYLNITAQKVAEIYELDLKELEVILEANFRSIFDF